MTNEKQLVENRNEKLSKMENIVNTAKTENRLPSEEEKAEFNNLKKEIENIDQAIEMDETLKNKALVKAPEPGEAEAEVANEAEKAKAYARDVKTFANTIRGIVNGTDQPTTKADGQVMIPTTIWEHIINKVIEISPIFDMADKFYVKGNFVIPYHDRNSSTLGMDYAEEFTDLNSGKIKLDAITLQGFLAGIEAKVSLSLINNTDMDLVGFVVDEIALQIKLWFERQLLYGTPGKIAGLSTIGEDMTVTTAASNAITADELMDLQDSVIDDYQANAIWIGHRKTRNAIRKLKNEIGDYLLNRDFKARWGYELLGKDFYCSDAMEQIGAGNTPLYYGDFSGLAVKITEAGEMQILREKYYTQHALAVVAWVEADAKIADAQKIACLKNAGQSPVSA